MIESLSLSDLVEPLAAKLSLPSSSSVSFSSVSSDSRTLQPGDLFVAIRGDQFDGHEFLGKACDAGACALVVESEACNIDCPQVVVADTTIALGVIAGLSRKQFQGRLIALTGSCGKTTVKEMLAVVLARCGQVHLTQGNLNNHIGVPQTLLKLSADSEYAVIEMGASGPGEIDYLAAISQPTVALVNNVMAAHLEGFGSEAGVAHEKSAIYSHLSANGRAVINADESYAQQWQQRLASTRADVQQITYSVRSHDADVYASEIELNKNGCYRFNLHLQDQVKLCELPVLGEQNIANALAVAACCLALDVDLETIVKGLSEVKPVTGRANPLQGVNGSLIIDDSYNANPGSVLAAGKLLRGLELSGREGILILGDLAELGGSAKESLFKLGEQLQALGLSQLITLGENSRFVGEGFTGEPTEQQQYRHFSDRGLLLPWVREQLNERAVVLVKGSRSARMENIVCALTLSGGQS